MALSSDLISQFVKVTKDDKKVKKETTVYGTVVYDGKPYVKLDGSDLLTPISTTANVKDGERVTVMIKDHTAIVTGNISSPAARTEDVDNVADQVTEFEVVTAHKVTTDDIQAINAIINSIIATTGKYSELESITAEFETLRADFIEGKTLKVEDIEAITAKIESIESEFGTFTDISTEDIEAVNAEITNLKGYTADFTYISAVRADVKDLDATKLSAKDANIKYATIDFANIGEAAFNKLFSETGIIENLVVDGQHVTGVLVGVTIKGDIIEGGTIIADKLVVQGEDGLYYKLNTDGVTTEAEQTEYNSLNGKVIAAKSITAEKISVSDLVAFGATVGGFHITKDSLYSGTKSSVENAIPGLYMDSKGQMSLGDGNQYLRYYYDSRAIPNVINGILTVVDKEDPSCYTSTVTQSENGNRLVITGGINPTTVVENNIVSIQDGRYKLAISADSILFGANSKASVADLKDLTEHVKIGTVLDEEIGYIVEFHADTGAYVVTENTIDSPVGTPVEDARTIDGRKVYKTDGVQSRFYCYDKKPCVELAEGDSAFKQVITNTKTIFTDGTDNSTEISVDGIKTKNVTINNELRRGNWVEVQRTNGNLGLIWNEVIN